MALQRVAVIFDHKVRPDTTGVYCRRALGRLVEMEHFLPSELSRIPRNRFDLYLNIDDGLRYRLPKDLRPAAWWAIDTHLDLPWYLTKAPDFDFVFTAQRDGALKLRDSGIESASWLPLACDPEVHRKHDVAKQFDVCFVGNLFPGSRTDLLEDIRKHFPNTFVGQRFFEEMAETYSASRIVFNRSIENDVNMRVFEALACGSLLLTNELRENGQEELFRDGIHLATYRDVEELLDKAAYYLKHEDFRERTAATGTEEALARHTYQHRMEQLLQEVEQRLAKTTVAVQAALPAESGQCSDPQAPLQHVLNLIPKSARRILQFGGQTGPLADALKARQPAEIFTIDEADTEAELPKQTFDVILGADSLERTRQPLGLLQRARNCLEPGGRLIANFANVRYHGVLRGLIQGNWTYDGDGPLNDSHLSFFTRREIEKLFYRAGFAIDALHLIPGLGYREWQEQGQTGTVSLGALQIQGLRADDAREFYVQGYIVSAAQEALPDYGLTSIVIITHNQLEYTRQCVESIRRFTDEPYEFVFVDNHSTDGTVEYLRSVPNSKLIINDENRGFPVAANQGIRASLGRQILLLNNDTVVTTGWLRRMLRALHSDPKVGLVGPSSNLVSGPQQVRVTYGDDLVGLDGFAWMCGKTNDGRMEETDRLVGFCFLIRREVVDRIGLMDERFGIGCFEDDDYTRRSMEVGFRAVIARDAFVHHYGGRTFVATGVDFAGLITRNQQLYRRKWNEQEESAQPASQTAAVQKPTETKRFSLRVGERGGLFLVGPVIRVSLCMIARDNKRTIGAAIESARRCVDEIIVVDTGSVDETPQIAASLGARVYHFPWCDNFSAARNESLKYATGDWIFWIDTDDTIDDDNARKIRQLPLDELDPSVFGLVVQVHCPGTGDDDDEDVTVVDHVKLFRNLPQLRFEHRIHEQILPAISRAGGRVDWSDLFVVHSGYDHSPQGQKKKLERDLRILHLELSEQPNHPFTLFNLGMTYADIREFDEAIGYLQRSIECSTPGETHLRKAYALLVHAFHQTQRIDEAWYACEQGLELVPDDLELRFRRAILLQDRARLHEAAETLQGILEKPEERHFTSVVAGLRGYKTRHTLAIIYEELDDLVRAEEQWRLITKEVPRYRAGWRGLGELLVQQGRHSEALGLAETLVGDERLRSDGLMIQR